MPPATPHFIKPNWPAPAMVRACMTTREGGHSRPPWHTFNLADHVGDDAQAVARNRRLLIDTLGLRAEPLWLNQVHGSSVIDADELALGVPRPDGDACVTSTVGRACAVLTADCVPLLLCDRLGIRVAAAHVGWRGLVAGVIEAAVDAMRCPAGHLLAWLGPGIGADVFEVGGDVRDILMGDDPALQCAFAPSPNGRWIADLHALARRRLKNVGVTDIHDEPGCTYSDPERFYSYRRDTTTGRMATLIWIHPEP